MRQSCLAFRTKIPPPPPPPVTLPPLYLSHLMHHHPIQPPAGAMLFGPVKPEFQEDADRVWGLLNQAADQNDINGLNRVATTYSIPNAFGVEPDQAMAAAMFAKAVAVGEGQVSLPHAESQALKGIKYK